MWPPANDPTKADSWPVFDEIGWAQYWSIDDWITWHGAMKEAWGQGNANARFLQAWNQDSFTHSAPLSARTFDGNFRDYAKANGFFDGLYGQGLSDLAKPLGAADDVVTDVSSAASTTGTLLKYVLPVMIVGFLGLFLWRKAK